MLDNNHIYNSISKSNTKFMKELLSEAERGDMGYVKKHDSIATVFKVMSGGKKLQVKLGKTGKKIVIDAKDIDILPESAMNERPRQLKDKNKEMLVVKDGKVQVIDKKDWKKYQKKGYMVAENDSVNEYYIKMNEGATSLIKPGDKVTIRTPQKQLRSGKVVMKSSHGGWVLNMGGAHGRPGVADDKNIVKVMRGGKTIYSESVVSEAVPSHLRQKELDAFSAYMKGKITAKELDRIYREELGSSISKKELQNFSKQSKSSRAYWAKQAFGGIPLSTTDKKVKELMRFAESVNEAIKYNKDGFVTKLENQAGKVVKDITLDGEKFVLKGNKYVSNKGGKDLHKSHFGIRESVNEASGEFVVFIEKDNGRKKLLHTKKSQRAANMFLTKNVDKILNTSGIRSVGSMSKDQWEKTEARFAENVKKSGMRTVTRKEWDRTHKDFKGMIKGQPHMMYLDKKTNVTKYGPVQIIESVNEGRISKTFKFPKSITTSKFDEIEADLSRTGIKSEPDFNTNTIKVSGDERKIMKIVNKYKGIEESVNEAEKMKMTSSQMKQLHKAFDNLSDDDFRRSMFSVVKRDKFIKLIRDFDKSSLQKLVKMKPNAPFSKVVQAYIDGRIKESVVDEAKMASSIAKTLKQVGYKPLFTAIDNSKRDMKRLGYTRGEIQDTLFSMFGDTDPKLVKKIKESTLNEIDTKKANLLRTNTPGYVGTKFAKKASDEDILAMADLKDQKARIYNRYMKDINDKIQKLQKKYNIKESVVSEKKVPKKGSADYHQHKIAVDTVKNPNKSLMGGPSAKEAEEILMKKFGYSKKEVEKLNESLLTEATRSQVGVVDKNGNIISTYVHLDGYPGYVGNILRKHYDGAKTKQLLKIAGKDGISVLDRDIKGAPGHTFDNRVKGQTLFYGRDRGDKGGNMIMKGKLDKIGDYIKSAEVKFGAEYVYLYDENSRKWFYADIGKSRTELYPL